MNGNHVPASFRWLSMQGLVATQLAAVLAAQVAWQDLASPMPTSRNGLALAYDVARGSTVLFGGFAGRELSDTWEWNGAAWTKRRPVNSPPARGHHALAHDLARGRTVLFGGSLASGGTMSDTWEWDGVTWLQRAPAQSPSGRSGHALAYDVARGRTVLFSGNPTTGILSDTWEWDGTNWLQRTPAQSPPARLRHALAYDFQRGRTVLFGGASGMGGPDLSDTWEWDGTNWTQLAPATAPPARENHALAYDLARGRTVLFGGPSLSDTWEWDGTNWSDRSPPVASSPAFRSNPALAYDSLRARTVLFGGYRGTALTDTWEWDGASWFLQTPATIPPVRRYSALAFDARRGRAVLFGGLVAPAALADTWEWNGIDWALRAPANSPPPRYWHALAYDSARGRSILFGGQGVPAGALADTWEWDGATWLQRTPAQSPPARLASALAYDAARARTVLFGGTTSPTSTSIPPFWDTWEWDGTNWSQRVSNHAPLPRSDHSLAYDSARGRTVLYGGLGSILGLPTFQLSDTWEWDGADWLQFSPPQGPPASSDNALAFDARRGRTVLFFADYFVDGVLWEYGPTAPGSYEPFGAGCAGSAGTASLGARRDGLRPYPGNAVTIDVAPVPANAAVLLSFGLSRTQWNAFTLPLPLSGIGMPGCTLYASLDASLLLASSGGTATWTFHIPNNQGLVGLQFYNQAFVVDPPANSVGIATTNAAEARIGSK